jgi:hypothetical protein
METVSSILYRINVFLCPMMSCSRCYNVKNNISAISWRSVLLVHETEVTWQSQRPVASQWQTLSHNVVHLALIEIRTNNISGDRHWLKTRYSWNIVESGVRHHQTNKQTNGQYGWRNRNNTRPITFNTILHEN